MQPANPLMEKEITLSTTIDAEAGPAARTSVLEIYEAGLSSQRLWAHDHHGRRTRLPVAQWCSDVLPGDASLLTRCVDSTLDIGCGPGRLTAALTATGVNALGIDISALAIAVARARLTGTHALQRSVFEPVPNSGRWDCALLADGNIGIGGDPVFLLRRIRQLLAPGGVVHVEVAPPGALTTALELHLEDEYRRVSETFAWAQVGADGLTAVASESDFNVTERWNSAGRWFASLRELRA